MAEVTGFTHLHLHSQYSVLDGHGTIDNYLSAAAADNQSALAVTDHGSIGGAVQFYKAAKEHGVKPIIGCEMYVDYGDGERPNYPDHLTVLASSEKGYRALIKAVSDSHRNFYYRPRLHIKDLMAYAGDWVILSGCMSSTISKLLMADETKAAEDLALTLASFAKAFYIEIMWHQSDDEDFARRQEMLLPRLMSLSRKTGIRMVLTNDCHYVGRQDEEIHQKFLREAVNKIKGIEFDGRGFYLKTISEMAAVCANLGLDTNVMLAANDIADMCNISIPEADTVSWYVPEIAPDPVSELTRMCAEKLADMPASYKERFEQESVVLRGAPAIAQSYLVAHDLVTWCHKNGIHAAGRGSMAGSIISWLLGITSEDPVKWSLNFKRAVNPARPTIPDFDIDVSSHRRTEVLEYLSGRYEDSCPISSYVNYGPKGALRMIMRAVDVPYAQMDYISKGMPDDWQINIDFGDQFEIPEQYRPYLASYRGLYSTMSVHPAGFLISGKDRPLEREVPMQWIASSGTLASSYDMYTLKKLGLFKLDILGLRALDQLAKMERLAGEPPPYGTYDDPDVLKALNDGFCADIFQLEGNAARNCIKEIGIKDFEDIVVVNTISRPGAAQFIGDYKIGNRRLVERYPAIEPILSYSRGVILYQEQVMEICAVLAGFDDAEQDTVKEAIKYFDSGAFEKLTDRFLSACKDGQEIWDAMVRFAGYSFNRAHAVSYAALAYRMAWYKVKHPLAFFASVFDDSPNKRALLVEGHNFGVRWRMPDVNLATYDSSIFGDSIMVGLCNLKGFGTAAYNALCEQRKHGPILTIEDLQRPAKKKVNAKIRDILEKVGLLDAPPVPSVLKEVLEFPIGFLNSDLTRHVDVKSDTRLGGFITSSREHIVKTGKLEGQKMGYLNVSNRYGSFRVVVFPEQWKGMRGQRVEAVIFEGYWSKTERGMDFIAEKGKACRVRAG